MPNQCEIIIMDTVNHKITQTPPNKNNNFIKNNNLLTLLTTLSLLTAIAGCGNKEAAPPTVRPALTYKIPASGGTEIDVYSGEIRARVEADHAFRINGKIIKRLVDAGANVKRGQVLAQLDPLDAKLNADAARAQVNAQQTEADFADAELKRFRDLFTKGFVSQSALDQKINLANASRARLDAQKASANVSLNQAGYATLVAEMDGVVTQVLAEAGQVVNAGQAVMKVANPKEKELLIAVPEAKMSEFRQDKKGAQDKRPIRVHLWSSPEKNYPATVREIAGAADPTTRTYAARLSITGADDIGLGMSAYAAFVGSDAAGTFAVPLSSLYVKGDTKGDTKGNSTGVWQIAADGKVTFKVVTVVQYRETTALISATTIKAGDSIVAAGVHKLRDGEVVKPIMDTQVKGDGKVAYTMDSPNAPGAAPAIAEIQIKQFDQSSPTAKQ
jgi:membrane fusion protein, multidrug efflux system